MIPASFDYVRPATAADAVQALAEAGEDAKVLAGGQSLLPILRLRLAYPSRLIDLGGIGELAGVRDDGDAIVMCLSEGSRAAAAELRRAQHGARPERANIGYAHLKKPP